MMLWKTLDPVRSEHGLAILPMAPLSTCPTLHLVFVPGGAGINPLLEDAEVLAFLRRAAAAARCVVSVSTGALVLGAAGLLRGRRAATHWMARDLLHAFGAEPVADRVVVDGKIFTGGGVTAGIDVALTVAAEIAGRATAEAIQLAIEYGPRRPLGRARPRRPIRPRWPLCWPGPKRASAIAPSASPAPPRRCDDLRSLGRPRLRARRLAAGGCGLHRDLRASDTRFY